MLDDSLVWLALAVLKVFDCARVWSGVVAGFEVRAVALDVAGGAAAAGSGKADVGGHCGCDNVCWGCEWRVWEMEEDVKRFVSCDCDAGLGP